MAVAVALGGAAASGFAAGLFVVLIGGFSSTRADEVATVATAGGDEIVGVMLTWGGAVLVAAGTMGDDTDALEASADAMGALAVDSPVTSLVAVKTSPTTTTPITTAGMLQPAFAPGMLGLSLEIG